MKQFYLLISIILLIACQEEQTTKPADEGGILSRENLKWHFQDTTFLLDESLEDSTEIFVIDKKHLKENHQLFVKVDGYAYIFESDSLISSVENSLQGFSLASRKNLKIVPGKEATQLILGVYSVSETDYASPVLQSKAIDRKTESTFKNLFFILLIAGVIFLVVVKLNFSKRFTQAISTTKIFTTRFNEGEQARVRIFDQDNIIISLFYTFLTASFIFFILSELPNNIVGVQQFNFWFFLKVWSIVIILLLVKIIAVFLFSNLFGERKISGFYIKEMLNINLFFVLVIFFTSIAIYLNQEKIPEFWMSALPFIIVLAYLIRLLLLYFKILKLSNFSNLYLFSYFCSSEIFPFLIGLKYFI